MSAVEHEAEPGTAQHGHHLDIEWATCSECWYLVVMLNCCCGDSRAYHPPGAADCPANV